MLSTLLLLLARAISTEAAWIDNTAPRRDAKGNILVGGDGSVQRFGSTYYLYMQNYGACQQVVVNGTMCVLPLNHTCGYLYNHSVAVYTTTDFANFQLQTMNAWPTSPDGVKFRVKVIYNAQTKLYVMWMRNVPLRGGAGGSEASWLEEQYLTATSASPVGPFITESNVAVKYGPGGDNSLFVDDDGQAYLVYTSHPTGVRISVERLTRDYLGSTNESSGPFGPRMVEAPAMFKRRGFYYVSFGPGCCYCTSGSSVDLYVSSSPLGPYELSGPLAAKDETHAQQNYIFQTASGAWVWTGTRWGSALDGLFAHDLQTWLPISWDDRVSPPRVVPVTWKDSFDLNAKAKRHSRKPIRALPKPQLKLSGQWEVVFNYTTDSCSYVNPYGHVADFSDSVPTAWYDRLRGEVVLISANPFKQHANIGPSLDTVRHDCTRSIFTSFNSTDPHTYANHQWIQSAKWHGDQLVALVHNEFHGENLNDSGICSWNTSSNGQTHPGPGKYRGECQLWSIGAAVKNAGSHDFKLIGKPPQHLVAAMPTRYRKDLPGPYGFGAISSLIEGDDGMLYGLVHVAAPRDIGQQVSGNCAFRFSNLTDLKSFRAWNGTHFSVPFPDPYLQAHEAWSCQPITSGAGERDGSSHPVPRRLVGFPKGWPRFLLLGLTETNPHAPGVHGGNITYSFSWKHDFGEAVTSWSEPSVIDLDLPTWSGVHGHVFYPAILDSSSPSMQDDAAAGGYNFELVGNHTAWLYVVLDRTHIVRRRLYFFDVPEDSIGRASTLMYI